MNDSTESFRIMMQEQSKCKNLLICLIIIQTSSDASLMKPAIIPPPLWVCYEVNSLSGFTAHHLRVLINAASIPQSSSPCLAFNTNKTEISVADPGACKAGFADRFPRRECVWLIQRSHRNVSVPTLTDSLERLPANTSFMLPVPPHTARSVQTHTDALHNTNTRFRPWTCARTSNASVSHGRVKLGKIKKRRCKRNVHLIFIYSICQSNVWNN